MKDSESLLLNMFRNTGFGFQVRFAFSYSELTSCNFDIEGMVQVVNVTGGHNQPCKS
jgi:hypothetical protein